MKKIFRTLALCYLWLQVITVLLYTICSHPIVKPILR